MTLSDLERQDVKGQIFQADLHIYAPTVWPRTTFGKVTDTEKAYFYGVIHVPILRERDLSVPKFIRTRPYINTLSHRATKFGMVQ